MTILHGDATAMPLPDAGFDGAVCFTMLYQVPSIELQNRLLAEIARVLRPDGILPALTVSRAAHFRLLPVLDTLVVVEPGTFSERLGRWFEDGQVEVNPLYEKVVKVKADVGGHP